MDKITYEALLEILKGIDKTELEDKFGWWETSHGASFGEGILAKITELFKKEIL
jgi:hypothetical protein